MEKKKKIFIIIPVVVFLGAVIFFKIEEISAVIIDFKANLFAVKEKVTQVDFSKYSPMDDKGDEWYVNNVLISHACGGIDGKTYTNSVEALELAIENGHKVIEIDMLLTSDRQVVLKHKWEEGVCTYEEFMNAKIDFLYSPLIPGDVLNYMQQNEDIYVVTDIKGDREYIGELLTKVVEQAQEEGTEDVLDRIIIQIYFEEDYDYICEIYPFKNWIYTLYASNNRDFNRVAEFCLNKDISVVTMPSGWVEDSECIKVFQDMNIKVFVHTLNDMGKMKKYREMGVYGFYTDFIKPENLSAVGIN